MRYVGLDVHKRLVQAFACDEQGQALLSQRFDLTREALERFAATELGEDCVVALEATTNTWAIADVLFEHCPNVAVSNPMRTKAIASAKIKTDRVDAATLAQLLRCNFLPMVWIPDAATREQRSLASRRSALVRQSIALKNRIHSVLHQRLVAAPEELFSSKGQAWLHAVELEPVARGEIDSLLRMLDVLNSEQAALRALVERAAFASEPIKLLMTLPGIDATTAHAIMAAVGDIRRFASADQLAAYFGLVPGVRQSAEHCSLGRITKQGNSNVRWLLVQAAQIASRHPGPLGLQFTRIERRKNRSVAVVAIARRLAVLVWHVLTRKTPYRYALPATVEAKLSRLRTSQQGRRKSGSTKGQPRSPLYGSGQGTRLRRGLDAALQSESLPPTTAASAAEQRVIDQMGLAPFAAKLQVTTRVPRDKASNSTPPSPGGHAA